MFRVGMLKNTLGTEHFLVALAKELCFFVFVDIAVLEGGVFGTLRRTLT